MTSSTQEAARLRPPITAWVAAAMAAATLLSARPAGATDLTYQLMSPSFGGNNGVALQMAQFQQNLQTQQAQAKAAAAKAAIAPDPNSAFVNAIISQLNGIIAQTIAQKIANSTNGQAGTIQSGSVTITYVNSDGQLSVTISSPSGTTTLTIPSGL